MPLDLHPHSPFNPSKFTKSISDMIAMRKHIQAVQSGKPEEVEESQMKVICSLNRAYYLNNKLYRSDFGQDYFEQQAGTTVVQGTLLGSQQNIVIASGKQIIRIM